MISLKRSEKEGNEEVYTLRYMLTLFKRSFLIIAFISFLVNLLMLIPALYMLAIYDIVIPSRSIYTLLMITGLAITLYLFLASFQIIRTKLAQIIGLKLDLEINNLVFLASIHRALKKPSTTSAQYINDVNQIRNFLTSQVFFSILDVPWIPIYIFVLFLFHPIYGIMSIIFATIILIISFINEKVTKASLKKSNELLIKSSTSLNHILQNAEVVEAMGMAKNLYNKWVKIYYEHLKAFKTATDKNNFFTNLIKSLRIMFQSLMLGTGAFLALNHEISMGMIITGTILLGRIMAPIDTLVSGWRNVSLSFLAYQRLKNLLNSFKPQRVSVQLPPPKGKITLRQVTVIPPEGESPVLKGITMNILPGEFVAIIGHSGSGKTSLLKTILGIWEPITGKVEIDDADINQWDREFLGKYIGYLPQDIELFDGTIAENIARFGEIDSEAVIEAAKLAGVHEMILKLPKGYDTPIGPGGIKLSGGQRQRIALARAVYGNPKIIILDEPDSNLDDRGEVALLNMLKTLKTRKATVIITSHRLRLLSLADKIAVLQDGMVKIFGKAEAVLQKLLESKHRR